MNSCFQSRRALHARRGFFTAVASLSLLLAACADGLGPGQAPQDQILFIRHADGDQLPSAYSMQADIYRVNADGTGLQNLTSQPAHYGSLSLSPDGRRVVFQSDRSGGVNRRIWVMNTDGTDLRPLTSSGDASGPRWSPDGTRIALQYEGHVYVMNADGSDLHNVSLPAMAVGQSCDPRTRIALVGWLPGGRIAFWRHYCGFGTRYFIVNADGTGFTQTEANLQDEAWSPDGSKVAFTQDGKVFVRNADGSGVRTLVETGRGQLLPDRMWTNFHSDYTPWSPDGERIVVFEAVVPGWCLSAAVVNVDGSGMQPLTDLCAEFNGWARGGDRVVFTAGQHLERDVYVIGADGTGLVNLTNSALQESSALWVPADR